MNALTPSVDEATLLQGATAAGRVSGVGIRDLLNNTALLVTTLSAGGTARDAGALREHCRQLIDHFSSALIQRGYPDDVRNEALVAQCGLLDEAALRYLPADSRSGWAEKPLQVERFNLHDAGERVFDRLEARMRETPPQIDLLECYSAVLGCGFVGRYARDAREGEAERIALIASLDARLNKLRPSSERPFHADRAGRRLSDRFYRLSPWAIAALGCVAAAIVWAAWAAGLDMQVADLVSAKVLQP
ncbi:DotU family type IV/VI secretion system protein [Burkholderia cenocepacia]|uniref:DotU family type IV/VI secretion system protein n=1 Tax=Burkholderia cenocepacia TaxID=95486 RepID=UPI001B90985E|nr:DotU family type IV/VI secretion system protein [Burkholderia cenocepacia]MBR7943610.1 DotU family type IV/VI secretion system protein [Burkholderia cenocepacia]MDN7619593.1 DotU family type IV/VI secretion system protein [Burkholderia cenocepacia]